MKVKLISVDAEIVLNDLPAMIGRNRTADVCLDDAGVGEFQCIIERDDGWSPISIATGGRGFLEENLSGSPKAEARAGAIVE